MLDDSALPLVRYPPERFVMTAVQTLSAGGGEFSSPPVYFTALEQSSLLARLDSVAVIPAAAPAAVALRVTADNTLWPPAASGGLSGDLMPQDLPDAMGITAARTLALQARNAGAGAATLFQLSCAVWFWRPTVADRTLYRLPLPANAERLKALWPAGWTPDIGPEAIVRLLYGNPQRYVASGTADVPVAPQTVTLLTDHPPQGWFDVLTRVDVDDSVGGTVSLSTRVSNAVTVQIVREGQALPSYPAAGLNFSPVVGNTPDTSRFVGTRPFVVARSSLSIQLSAAADVSGVPYHLEVWRVREQPIHRVLWGMPTAEDLAIPGLAERVQAGMLL